MASAKHLSRVDESGRAFAGSQRQIQTYVNHKTAELRQRLSESIAVLKDSKVQLQWVSPLARDGYVEYRDGDFLAAVGLEAHARDLARFWPQGGPCWDALARVEGASKPSVLLVEAKSHPAEMHSTCGAQSATSLAVINAALAVTKQWLGVPRETDWLTDFYQLANRYAHLYFLRKVLGYEAWLVNVHFLNDPYKPTTRDQWRAALADAHTRLGLPAEPRPNVMELFLEAAVE